MLMNEDVGRFLSICHYGSERKDFHKAIFMARIDFHQTLSVIRTIYYIPKRFPITLH